MAARETALNVLIACRKEDGWSNALLKNYIHRDGLDSRDAALATRLCYGVLQNRARLDYYLQQLLTGKVKDLHPVIRDILHMGLYQLLEMDRVPDSAAVSESVNLAKKYCRKQHFAPGLVNGVLRSAVREKKNLLPPTQWQEKYSHPQELIDLLKSYVGKAHIEPMLKANNEAPKTVVQVNTLKISTGELIKELEVAGVEAQPHSWMENALILSGTGDLERLSAFQKGWFYVQDPAAKLSVLCADLKPGQRVLDCCAAPGGKSFAAAIAMQGNGEIISCDIYAHKTRLISAGAERLGISCISAKQQDAAQMVSQWVGSMDTVIADVPCSGYGIIRKKPDIRYKSPKTMENLPILQSEILKNQASYVRPGGVLLYSTCTLVRQENEGVVESFLRENPDFTLEALPLPAVFPKNETGMLALVPGQYDTDGFFIAKLRRKPCI